jgi:CheY-like chemotaxis protein
VESELGRGSVFTVRLPREVAERRLPALSPWAGPAVGDTRRVLVVDDEPQTREVLARGLEKDGFAVTTAGSGEEALRLAAETRPDVISLDVLMPGMDGWTVLRALKADPRTADIPVVMISMLDSQAMGYALGAADYLLKPFDRERLVAVLRRYRCQRPPCPVLVVEDDPPTREVLRRTLEANGWVVCEAVNGRQGLAAVASNRPELVLLDLMMPEMDGFEFLAELRRTGPGRDVPVVVVTAKDLTEEDRLRLKGAAGPVLQKGAFTREELAQEIRRTLETARA